MWFGFEKKKLDKVRFGQWYVTWLWCIVWWIKERILKRIFVRKKKKTGIKKTGFGENNGWHENEERQIEYVCRRNSEIAKLWRNSNKAQYESFE